VAEPGGAVGPGLAGVAAALLAGASPPVDPLGRLAAPALAALRAGTAAGDAARCLRAATALLGLGPGLTPSRDDCLVGWRAGLWVGGADGGALLAVTAPGLLAAARERTGALSRAFLAAAVEGQVAEPVRAFVVAPGPSQRAALRALGATSGSDLLAGYCLARQALFSGPPSHPPSPPPPPPGGRGGPAEAAGQRARPSSA